jgi:hypothetical protein
MPRGIVYATTQVGPLAAGDGDGYLEKVAKYVPGEVLAFVVPAVATLKATDSQLLAWTFWIGLIATPLYLLYVAYEHTEPGKRPKPHFYLLAVAGYVVWALVGFDKLGGTFGFDFSVSRVVILPAWVLLAPMIDWVVGRLLKAIFPSYP